MALVERKKIKRLLYKYLFNSRPHYGAPPGDVFIYMV